MKAIWKYEVQLVDQFEVAMPRGAKVLDVQMQGLAPEMWALVDSEAPLVGRGFVILGTGEDAAGVGGGDGYIGTFQNGSAVWHLFEVTL